MGRRKVINIVTDATKFDERVAETNILENKLELEKVARYLTETMVSKNIAALAAPQIGYKFRMFGINFCGDVRIFINPMISKLEGIHLSREQSVSLPGRSFIVPRHDSIIAMYQTVADEAESNKFEGLAAEMFEQMVNLLDGVLLSDFGLEVFEDFDNATEEEQQEVLEMYINNLKQQESELDAEIESDEILSKTKNAIKYMTSVALGETKLALPTPELKLNRMQRRYLDKVQARAKKHKK